MRRDRRSGDPVERAMFAGEAHASATLLAILLVLWGAVSVFVVPARFRIVDVSHLVVGTLSLAWFLGTRRRPRMLIAYAFSALVITDALVVLPWITMTWCALGRPFEALTVPQIAMLCMALVVPRSLPLAVVVVALFLGEGLFVTAYADRIGLHARLPIGEPLTTLYFALPAMGLLYLRERRRRLARQHVRLRGETESLGRLVPLFARVRAELGAELTTLARELGREGADAPAVARMQRAAGQLLDVSEKLDELAADDGAPAAAALERELLARDAHLGAVTFAALVTTLALLYEPVMAAEVTHTAALGMIASAVAAALVLGLLVATRARPSEARARAGVVVIFAIALVFVSHNQHDFIASGRPFTPFIGHKLVMVMLGLTAASWAPLGLTLICLTAGAAFTEFYALDMGALRDRISLVEPWITFVFFVVGVAALLLRDQRRLASVTLLRDETEAWALHRRARLLLGLRDRLNTPVQTLVIGSSRLALGDPGRDRSQLDEAVARLVALSRELAQLEVSSAAQAAALGGELERRAAPLNRPPRVTTVQE